MPAATETRTRRLHRLAVAGDAWTRPGDPAANRSSGPVDPATHARFCAPPGRRWPRSSRMQSGLTFPQPLGPNVTVLDGPCDPGSPSDREWPGAESHGRMDHSKKGLSTWRLTFPDSSAARLPRPTFSCAFDALPPRPTRRCMAGSTGPQCVTAPDRRRDAWPPRSNSRCMAGSTEPPMHGRLDRTLDAWPARSNQRFVAAPDHPAATGRPSARSRGGFDVRAPDRDRQGRHGVALLTSLPWQARA
jgi:hypothetical protein